MERDPRSYLWDVQAAAEDIQSFIKDVDLDGYAENSMLHSAVERKLEIIGEALNQLSKTAPDLASRIPDLPAIVAFRNLLIHGYAIVDHRRVWGTLNESLPSLRITVTALLEELGPP